MRFAVDGILFKDNKIILIRRGGRTFHGYWALPGGILEEGESVEQTLLREMKEELGVDVTPIEILGVYSDKNRDPREHTISVVFICEFQGSLQAGDDAKDYQEFTLEKALELQLAFDHKKILMNFISWMDTKSTFWSSK
ncbi:MAG: NUDIX domain-containing protein [Candidatus Thorarchaeota archaeon]